MVAQRTMLKALRRIVAPEIGLSVVDLGMICVNPSASYRRPPGERRPRDLAKRASDAT